MSIASPLPALPPIEPVESGADLRADRILIAEDSATARILLRHWLEKIFPQARLDEAADGKAALKALSAAKVDLVVTDLQMPGIDGAAFIQMLRHSNVLKRKPVLVVTMSPELVSPEVSTDPWVRVLAKPLQEASLRRALAQLLA